MRQIEDGIVAAVLDGAPDAIVCVDDDGRIVLVNSRAAGLFGYAKDQLLGEPVKVLVPEPAMGGQRVGTGPGRFARPMASGPGVAGRRRDGSTFPADIELGTVEMGERALTVATIRDSSDELAARAECEQLKAAAERGRRDLGAQRAYQLESLARLAGGVAHDFNNLLGVIANYAAFIAEEVDKDPGEVSLAELREDIAEVERAADRAVGLTRQLLAFARRDPAKPRELDLSDVVSGAQPLVSAALGGHVTMTTCLDPDLPPVLADPSQVEEVLVNLVANACEAMPDGGSLSVTTGLAEEPDGDYVFLQVSDTGIGVPPDVLDRVFEPFYSTKPKGRGSGLGLATVHGIASQAGGDARITSELGMGTTVTVLLPLLARPAPARAPVPAPGGGEVVLVVEDESQVREVVRRILDRNGYRVLVAASGQEAIDLVASREGRVDVLLTDVVMPQMLGMEVADRVEAIQPDVRVLFMSGHSQGLLSATNGGINLLAKPFTESTLLAKLHEVLPPAGGER